MPLQTQKAPASPNPTGKKKARVIAHTGFVLAETEGFEPSMRLYTPYSLSRGAI